MTDTEQVAPGPLIRPPRLHLGTERTASRLELFFDLAYVLVAMELAKGFYENLTWHGLAVLTGSFVIIWLSWVGFTLYANRFDTDDVVFRIAKLAATGSIAGCAASALDAFGKTAVPFAACYLASQLLLLALYARAWRHVGEARPTINVYLITVGASAAVWALSLVVAEPTRFVLWAVAALISASGPVLATLRSEQARLHVEHLPERFGLLVILVLGEAVGGAARGVHDAGWAPVSIVVGVLAFVIAGGMWWIYFDIAATSSNRELQEADEEADEEAEQESDEDSEGDRSEGPQSDVTDDANPVDLRHDLFVYGHLPLSFGVVLTGVGLEELVTHPDTGAPSAGGWIMAGGLAVFLAGVALVISGTTHTLRSVWPWPLAAIPILLAAEFLPIPGALLLTAGYAVIVVFLAVHGTLASRRPDTALAGAD